jgi:hypothetical protein
LPSLTTITIAYPPSSLAPLSARTVGDYLLFFFFSLVHLFFIIITTTTPSGDTIRNTIKPWLKSRIRCGRLVAGSVSDVTAIREQSDTQNPGKKKQRSLWGCATTTIGGHGPNHQPPPALPLGHPAGAGKLHLTSISSSPDRGRTHTTTTTTTLKQDATETTNRTSTPQATRATC